MVRKSKPTPKVRRPKAVWSAGGCVAFAPEPQEFFEDGAPWPPLPGQSPCDCADCKAKFSPEGLEAKRIADNEREARRFEKHLRECVTCAAGPEIPPMGAQLELFAGVANYSDAYEA